MTFTLNEVMQLALRGIAIFKPELHDEVLLALKVLEQGYEAVEEKDFTKFTGDFAVMLAKVKAGEQIL